MKEFETKALINKIPEVTAFIDEELEKLGCSMKDQMQIDVAIDELFANIAHYAYGKQIGDVKVSFDFDPETRIASVTFTDSGIPFNPLENDDPDVTLSLEDREIGGLGIFLVKKTMHAIEYLRENGQNILTIKKTLKES